MKRILAVLLALILIVSVLCSCSGADPNADATSDSASVEAKSGKIKKNTEAEDENKDDPAPASKTNNSKLAESFDSAGDVSYVMIYNPDIYDENSSSNKKLSTGKLSKWIDTSVSRADGLETEPEITRISQSALSKGVKDVDADTEGDRASSLQPTYKENDKQDFYYLSNTSSDKKEKDTYTCSYVGKYCYVWTLPSENIKNKDAETIANEFDKKIYDKDVKLFGKPRYADDGGKIHLLFHTIKGSVCGYFSPLDLFTSSEVTKAEAAQYQLNLDHAIIHINSGMIGKDYGDVLYSTIAHEFQHLINFTDAFYNNDLASSSTWLNEAMSGYAEEAVYPGIMEDQYMDLIYSSSDLIRDGQSLYNFDTNGYDIGVYGSVYFFSEYLAKNGGSSVFSKIHKYWREKYSSTTDDAESIQKSVDSSYSKRIDSVVTYPSSLKFKTKSQEWMSKMTLDYYLSLMKYDTSDPSAYKLIKPVDMLYDEVNAAKIEGGGRIIFATKDGKFSIPDDADKNLVYVGFDKDMNQVTAAIVK